MHLILSCPVCGQNKFSQILTTQDYTTTKEAFTIEQCQNCQFLLTNPQPESHSLSRYYESSSYISHKESSKGLLENIYYLARKFNLRWKVGLIKRYAPHAKSILDFGCGVGDFLQTCRENKIEIAGIEPFAVLNEQYR